MHRRGGCLGCGALATGIVILLALILPGETWWFLIAAALICIGIWCIKRCI